MRCRNHMVRCQCLAERVATKTACSKNRYERSLITVPLFEWCFVYWGKRAHMYTFSFTQIVNLSFSRARSPSLLLLLIWYSFFFFPDIQLPGKNFSESIIYRRQRDARDQLGRLAAQQWPCFAKALRFQWYMITATRTYASKCARNRRALTHAHATKPIFKWTRRCNTQYIHTQTHIQHITQSRMLFFSHFIFSSSQHGPRRAAASDQCGRRASVSHD